jgi:hypothetical protein
MDIITHSKKFEAYLDDWFDLYMNVDNLGLQPQVTFWLTSAKLSPFLIN